MVMSLSEVAAAALRSTASSTPPLAPDPREGVCARNDASPATGWHRLATNQEQGPSRRECRVVVSVPFGPLVILTVSDLSPWKTVLLSIVRSPTTMT